MFTRRGLLILGSLTLAGAAAIGFWFHINCQPAKIANGLHPSETVRVLVGDRMIAIVANPTRVEAFRLDEKDVVAPDNPLANADRRIAGTAVVFPATELSAELSAEVGSALLSGRYLPGYLGGNSPFRALVGFRFWRGKDRADVAVSFDYPGVTFRGIDAEGRVFRSAGDGFWVPDLLPTLRKIFPGDREIQTLSWPRKGP